MKKNKNIQRAEEIAEIVIEASQKRIPGEFFLNNKRITLGNLMIDDFGDYLPFFAWLGKLNRKKYSNWAELISNKIISNFQLSNGLLITNFDSSKRSKSPKTHSFNADKMSDALLGINLMYQLTLDKKYLSSSAKLLRGIKRIMLKRNFVIYKSFLGTLQVPLSSGKYAGLYIEEAVRLYEFTKEKEYLYLAKNMTDAWINNTYFIKNGIFPFVCTSTIMKPFVNLALDLKTTFNLNTAMLTKANTNLISGICRLYRHTGSPALKNALLKWGNSVEKKLLLKNGTLSSIYEKGRGARKLSYLAADQAAIEVLLDIYMATNDKHMLDLAVNLSRSWIALAGKTGLIPEIPFTFHIKGLSPIMVNESMKKKGISRLDSQTDFGIVLLKLYELTKKQYIKKAADRILNAVFKYHVVNQNVFEFVNVQDGSLIEPANKIETKMLTLLLKFPLVKYEITNKKRIYKDGLLRDLLRDR